MKLPRTWSSIFVLAASNVMPSRTIFVAFSEKLLYSPPAFSYSWSRPPNGASLGVPGLQTLYVCPMWYPASRSSSGKLGIAGSHTAPTRMAPRPVR